MRKRVTKWLKTHTRKPPKTQYRTKKCAGVRTNPLIPQPLFHMEQSKNHHTKTEKSPPKKMPPEGLEHPAKTSGKIGDSESGGAESGAVGAELAVSDPELAKLVTLWSGLTPAIRRSLVALAEEMGNR